MQKTDFLAVEIYIFMSQTLLRSQPICWKNGEAFGCTKNFLCLVLWNTFDAGGFDVSFCRRDQGEMKNGQN
jgi:hypothetical protein